MKYPFARGSYSSRIRGCPRTRESAGVRFVLRRHASRDLRTKRRRFTRAQRQSPPPRSLNNQGRVSGSLSSVVGASSIGVVCRAVCCVLHGAPCRRTIWRRCQSAANSSPPLDSLRTGKTTGNSPDFRGSREFGARIAARFRPATRELRAHANREFLRPNREILWQRRDPALVPPPADPPVRIRPDIPASDTSPCRGLRGRLTFD